MNASQHHLMLDQPLAFFRLGIAYHFSL